MSLIPMMRCRDMRTSVAFYTRILDFELTEAADDPAKCDFITLARGGDRLAQRRSRPAGGSVKEESRPARMMVFWLGPGE